MGASFRCKCFVGVAAIVAVAVGGVSAFGQMGPAPTFSIDLLSPTLGAPDSFYASGITASDVLSGPVPLPGGPPAWPYIGSPGPAPVALPGLVVHGGGGLIPPPGVRSLALVPGQGISAELDALSYGRDFGPAIAFSVDSLARGNPGLPAIPNVASEGVLGANEAAADVYRDIGNLLPLGLAGALPPGLPGIGAGNTIVYDGNAAPSPAVPPAGFGLTELPPFVDNLDALDMDTTAADARGPLYFSLDSGFIDPATGIPNSNSAVANGFVGGDVIVDLGGGLQFPYATAAQLGLDLQGPDTDDLDALILNDVMNDGEYDPVNDLLLFSVRRGSAIIGTLDSIFGAPIEEGDVLAPPMAAGGAPGIIVPAEWLGLLTTRTFGEEFGDDLVAADLVPEPTAVAMLLSAALAGLLMWVRRKRPA